MKIEPKVLNVFCSSQMEWIELLFFFLAISMEYLRIYTANLFVAEVEIQLLFYL